MPIRELVCSMKAYIQPFERILALRELESVSGADAVPDPCLIGEPLVYRVTTLRALEDLAKRLTYWESVCSSVPSEARYTQQVLREATPSLVRNGVPLSELRSLLPMKPRSVQLPNRRVLRYGSHGVHEYRGKFFPQLVRALLNIAGVEHGDKVLDPMCGSGTTLIEASLMGCEAIGMDMNPLSLLMSRAKCDIFKVPADVLADEYQSLRTDVLRARGEECTLDYYDHLPEKDRTYLADWFSSSVLADLDHVALRVHETRQLVCRDLFRVCLSNILRRVSWQKEDDLRVRREVRSDVDCDSIAEFLSEVGKTVRAILAFLYNEPGFLPGPVQFIEGDARNMMESLAFSGLKGKLKAIITSPPYATALPYLDTDRLSLCYLGLLTRSRHRERDYRMIGNREVTESRRRSYWRDYERQRVELPEEITILIDRIQDLNERSNVGFRRRNLAALLARYFLDMRKVFEGMAFLLKRGGWAFVVIGNNHTVAGGQRVEIETDRLLALLGQRAGLNLDHTIRMEMLVSRDIFRKNAVGSESILCFRK